MDYDAFITMVQRAANIDRVTAEQVVAATLETLAERLSPGQAEAVAAELPPGLSGWLATETAAQDIDADTFVRRVAARAELDRKTAERVVPVVFQAIERTLDTDGLRRLAAQLPPDYAPLLTSTPGAHGGVMPTELFLQRVAERAGVDEAAARRATRAVLETLADRLSGGEIEDLREELPYALRPPLEDVPRTKPTTALGVEEFLERVAAREEVSTSEALEQARAVFATLREALSGKQFDDLRAQLSRDYEVLLVPVAASSG
jgi:uncharacterized protein (DUF2267 family)